MSNRDGSFPSEIQAVREKVEEYVEQRVRDFAKVFAEKYLPELTETEVLEATIKILKELPSRSTPSSNELDLYLVFRHDCLALGCRDSECTLCQFNPLRLCDRNFSKKYLVGDILKAKCGASIKVELHDADGQRYDGDLPGMHFEVSLIDGVVFKEKAGEVRTLSVDDMKACVKFVNGRDEALLQHKAGVSNNSRKVILRIEKGQVVLPELQVTDSSEALLTGRKPPFRLLVSAVNDDGNTVQGIRYAVSEEFVVATRRVKQANKADIPLMDDHVSKIEHIGRETVKKLQDMVVAANEIGMQLQLPEKLLNITTVGQFLHLVEQAEKDSQLKKVLQIVLKLSREKWEEAAHHATQAVVSDFRRRIWYPPTHNVGLLFNCKYGAVQLKDPVCLIPLTEPVSASGSKIIPEDELDPSSLNALRQLKSQAVTAWWSARHPGWAIFKEAQEAPKPQPNFRLDNAVGTSTNLLSLNSSLSPSTIHTLSSALLPPGLLDQQSLPSVTVNALNMLKAGGGSIGSLPTIPTLNLDHPKDTVPVAFSKPDSAKAAGEGGVKPMDEDVKAPASEAELATTSLETAFMRLPQLQLGVPMVPNHASAVAAAAAAVAAAAASRGGAANDILASLGSGLTSQNLQNLLVSQQLAAALAESTSQPQSEVRLPALSLALNLQEQAAAAQSAAMSVDFNGRIKPGALPATMSQPALQLYYLPSWQGLQPAGTSASTALPALSALNSVSPATALSQISNLLCLASAGVATTAPPNT